MKLVLSPAKSLELERELPITRNSEACFLKEAERLNRLIKKKSARSLSKLMHISPSLGQLNYERNQIGNFLLQRIMQDQQFTHSVVMSIVR